VPDVLTFTVPLPSGTYPSVNHTGGNAARQGKKTPEYHDLFKAVRDIAAIEMERIGWQVAANYCDVTIVRVRADCRLSDASNLSKCEFDAMQPSRPPRYKGDLRAYRHPFPGVFTNDALVVPHPKVEFDAEGPDRLVIIVRRVFPFVPLPGDAVAATGRARKPRARVTAPVIALPEPLKAPAAADEPYGMLNGRPISYAEARDLALKSLERL
jgi:hypothetical protein